MPLAHAGRRSAGLGGDGRGRPGAHAVGVRARGEWAIWSVVGHLLSFESLIMIFVVTSFF